MFLGIPVVMAYNLLATILRSLGDGQTPLYAMILAALSNILLDLVFVLVFSGAMLILQRYVDLSRFIYHTGDGRSTLLAPVASGVINGYIYGCAIRLGGSTGGTDFLAAYVHKIRPEYSLIRVLFAFNVSVALLSYFVYDFNVEPVILCIAYCFITSHVSDNMIKGGEQAIKVELITSHPEQISKALIEGLKGKAVDADGNITLDNLEKYIRETVRKATNGKQMPIFENKQGNFILFGK
jgi:uncharacterized membrane-anchored protein YitT (DUF2179 family)